MMYNTNTNQQPIYTQPSYAQYLGNRPIYPNTVLQGATTYMGIKGRPVASIEEARASIIDFDGSIFYFPDLANKRIYTKQINMDGTALLNVYELKELPIEPEITPNEYITRAEFEAVINALRTTPAAPAPATPPEQPVAKPALALNF